MDARLAETAAQERPASMPRVVRGMLLGAVGLLLTGALYLISVRGEALLLDLSAFSQRIFCF
jgi:hypothetical protein